MKHFSRAQGRLAHLPLAARVVYSVFLAFTLVGVALSAWLAGDMVGLDLSGLHAYYAGGEAETGDAAAPASGLPAPAGGPTMDLPPELDAPSAPEPMPLRKLLEVTHFHLFSMPVYLLVLSHLFMLSGLAPRAKVAWIATASVSVAGHVAAPWLVRAGIAGSGLAYGATGAALAVSFSVLGGVALWEMWLGVRSPDTA